MLNISLNFKKAVKYGMNHWSFNIYNLYNAMNPNLVYMDGSTLGSNENKRIIVKQISYLPILPSFSYTFKF